MKLTKILALFAVAIMITGSTALANSSDPDNGPNFDYLTIKCIYKMSKRFCGCSGSNGSGPVIDMNRENWGSCNVQVSYRTKAGVDAIGAINSTSYNTSIFFGCGKARSEAKALLADAMRDLELVPYCK